jgi:hypothetical protein
MFVTPLDAVEQNAADALDARPGFRKTLYPMTIMSPDLRTGESLVVASRQSMVEISLMLHSARDVRAWRLQEYGWVEDETTLKMAQEISALAALVAHRRQQAAS